MPPNSPDRPAWLRETRMSVARPLDKHFDPSANRYIMACVVSSRTNPVFLIAWRAHDPREAEATFLEWIAQGWAIMTRTFFDERCRYVFRTSAISGFVVLPPRSYDILDDDY
jgi:hypothetical protein